MRRLMTTLVAAALVVGMNVGTTFTAALATVGGSVAMRRTGFAHVVYNCLTGVGAFFLIRWIMRKTRTKKQVKP